VWLSRVRPGQGLRPAARGACGCRPEGRGLRMGFLFAPSDNRSICMASVPCWPREPSSKPWVTDAQAVPPLTPHYPPARVCRIVTASIVARAGRVCCQFLGKPQTPSLRSIVQLSSHRIVIVCLAVLALSILCAQPQVRASDTRQCPASAQQARVRHLQALTAVSVPAWYSWHANT
jgi:hypothetical protein